ncbi:hypothetical protein N7495_001568 [Penicillium taxi]|uniref:uncharacterized protein n=1 Tax=Penicillium taxi TaxID=168475 RepID=UPI0025454CC2|nr:uncharacterized protein N7495_001568 [Penicillium taxi]KAJ5908886.1 hypothetical protein N7495_001568 [Penicillium taxi]
MPLQAKIRFWVNDFSPELYSLAPTEDFVMSVWGRSPSLHRASTPWVTMSSSNLHGSFYRADTFSPSHQTASAISRSPVSWHGCSESMAESSP